MQTSTQNNIPPTDLVCMNDHAEEAPLIIDMVYADADHPENIFDTALYRPEAKLWLHKTLAEIVLEVAARAFEDYAACLVLKDGLRTVEAQAAMQETEIVMANPQWCLPGPDRLLSPPGKGGHPRGMAIDVTLVHLDGQEWDMGTAFDYLTTDPDNNPAARDYKDFTDNVLRNRDILETLFVTAASKCGQDILPLPSEWWDFRFPAAFSDQFAPISDHDLPDFMRMTDISVL